MEERKASRTGRMARYTFSWTDSFAGLIGFLDTIRIWELAGEIPQQFYTFPMMLRVFSMSFSFAFLLAFVGNIFDIIKPFVGVYFTPLWYGLVFVFLYLRYYGSFGSFGINVYRTVVSTTIITLFILDNLMRFILAYIGVLLSESSHPTFKWLASYMPSFGFHVYHLLYFVVLALPKKKGEQEIETKPLYSNKVVEITEEEYDALVETPGVPSRPSEPSLGAEKPAPTPASPSFSPSPATPKSEEKPQDDMDDLEEVKKAVKELDGDFKSEAFLWGKNVYVRADLVSANGHEKKKVKVSKDGEVLFEGEYIKVPAGKVLDKEQRSAIAKVAMNRAKGIKVEEV